MLRFTSDSKLNREFNATESLQMTCECYKCLAINPNCLRILYEYVKNMISLRILGACSQFSQQLQNFTECLQKLPTASEFLAINANLLKIAFGRAFAREIRYMGEQYKKKRKCIICVAKTKALISFAVYREADLRLCFRQCRLLVFPFSHVAAQMLVKNVHMILMSRCIRKPTTCIGETNGGDQLCYTDNTIPLLLKSKPASVTEQAGLCLHWSETQTPS